MSLGVIETTFPASRPGAAPRTRGAGGQGTLATHHLNSDFSLCDIFDVVPKSDLASMEHRPSRLRRGRNDAQALRAPEKLACAGREAAEEVGVQFPAPGVPQDDRRHHYGWLDAGLPTEQGALRHHPHDAPRRGVGAGSASRPLPPRGGNRSRCASAPMSADWQSYWQRSGQPRLRSEDAAFLGFERPLAQR